MPRLTSQRPQVLNAIENADGPLTVPEIAEAAGCALVTVRRHVTAMLRDGTIRRAGTRARPMAEDGDRAPGRGYFQYALNISNSSI